MIVDFYRAFEDRFRGSRELIKERLRVYLPFIEPLKKIYTTLPTVDLGCGRGEWLELLSKSGFHAHGVDLDEAMLATCRVLDLSVEIVDAISYLQGLQDESQVVISAFHVAEHISFIQLQTLVSESLRILKPGGLLILETPNAENITVGTNNFYFDPTHTRPIPSQLLAFIPEYYGYNRTKVLYLQESKELAVRSDPTLMEVINGVSPDFSIIAQKGASVDILKTFDDVFSEEYGLTLSVLASRFESRHTALTDKVEEHIVKLSSSLAQRDNELQLVFSSLAQRDNELQIVLNSLTEHDNEVKILSSSLVERDNEVKILSSSLAVRDNEVKILSSSLVERDNEVKILSSLLAERDNEVKILSNALAKQSNEVLTLSNALGQHDNELELLDKAWSERDNEIQSLSSAIGQRDSQIASLSSLLAQRESEAELLSRTVMERDGELHSIYNTTAGKFVRFYKTYKKKIKRM